MSGMVVPFIHWRSRRDSNPHLSLRRAMFYPVILRDLTNSGGREGNRTPLAQLDRLADSPESYTPKNFGDLGRTRTCGLRLRKPLLYPLSYETLVRDVGIEPTLRRLSSACLTSRPIAGRDRYRASVGNVRGWIGGVRIADESGPADTARCAVSGGNLISPFASMGQLVAHGIYLGQDWFGVKKFVR